MGNPRREGREEMKEERKMDRMGVIKKRRQECGRVLGLRKS